MGQSGNALALLQGLISDLAEGVDAMGARTSVYFNKKNRLPEDPFLDEVVGFAAIRSSEAWSLIVLTDRSERLRGIESCLA